MFTNVVLCHDVRVDVNDAMSRFTIDATESAENVFVMTSC